MQVNNLANSSSKQRPNFDLNLEGLRGYAALAVGYTHIFGFKNLIDPSYHPANYLDYLLPAHASVLIFFMLSGYVIGLTNPISNFSLENTRLYLIRRAVRLIPIYWIAILFSISVTPGNSLIEIFGNLFLFQGMFVDLIRNNTILWTLNYEFFYYLLFLGVWWLKPKLSFLLLISLTIAIIGWLVPNAPQLLHGYAAGWIFWLIGLGLAWQMQSEKEKSRRIPLLSYIFLLTATDSLSFGRLLLFGFGLKNVNAPIISLADLTLLPICLLLFTAITNRRILKLQSHNLKWIELTCFAIPVIGCLFLFATKRLFDNIFWINSAIFTILAILFWRFKIEANILSRLAGMGRIYYAFYIFHTPVMHLIHNYFPYQGSIWSFIFRSIIWFTLTIGISIFLELVMQPIIKRNLLQKLI
ncbi:MAG: hypothetical protein AUK48_06395 [Oscillatoriales cyanobacterium CG2_30_44_21]|nr:MAG: hypothetical protein AUK48_06395 [Oscillatoriales cyanobacterium CG2_30_44_21]